MQGNRAARASRAQQSISCATVAPFVARCHGRLHNPGMSTPPFKFSLEPARDKPTLRKQLKAERLAMADRHQRSVHMQEVLRVWLVTRPETSIGAYWPIKG